MEKLKLVVAHMRVIFNGLLFFFLACFAVWMYTMHVVDREVMSQMHKDKKTQDSIQLVLLDKIVQKYYGNSNH